ncbi:MAG: hypothetical protein JO040_01790 [Gemmatimonadetes bacterium]|nr:hypothetical protein [Gemmatimonadota bacterium]
MPISPGGTTVTYGGQVSVGFYTRYNGSGWVLRGTRSYSNYSGSATTRSYSSSVSVDGLGYGAEYMVQVTDQYDLGGSVSLTSVTYKTGSVNEAGATPGDVSVPFIALGGA